MRQEKQENAFPILTLDMRSGRRQDLAFTANQVAEGAGSHSWAVQDPQKQERVSLCLRAIKDLSGSKDASFLLFLGEFLSRWDLILGV